MNGTHYSFILNKLRFSREKYFRKKYDLECRIMRVARGKIQQDWVRSRVGGVQLTADL